MKMDRMNSNNNRLAAALVQRQHKRTVVAREAWRWALEHWGARPPQPATWTTAPARPVDIDGDEPEPIIVCGETPVEEVRALHAPGSVPIVIRGAARSWPATSSWSLDWLAAHHGDHEVSTSERDADGSIVAIPLRDAMERTRAGRPGYARFSPLLIERPELVDDLDLDYLLAATGSHPRAVLFQLFAGATGTRTETHCAVGNNAFAQVHGEKIWRFVAPRHSAALNPLPFGRPYFGSAATLHDPRLSTHPDVPIHDVHLLPGDVLLVPPFWWHQVDNPTESIGVAMRWHHPLQAFKQSTFMTLMTLTSRRPNIVRANRDRRRFGFIYEQTMDQSRALVGADTT